MTSSRFESDRRRYRAAARLRPEHFEDFSRLVKTLRFGTPFQLLILEFNDVRYRDELRQQLDEVLRADGLEPVSCTLGRDAFSTIAQLESRLVELASVHRALHVFGGESWFDSARWHEFNLRREVVAQHVAARLMLWLTTASVGEMALAAPDLWAWRSGVFSFTTQSQRLLVAERPRIDPHSAQHASRFKRIAELRHDLGLHPRFPQDIQLHLMDELAGLLETVGELNEALRIRREEELPVYERLGDVREKAVTQGKIAQVLHSRGQLQDALKMLTTQVLPVFQKLRLPRETAWVLHEIQVLEAESCRGL